jgi:hypothetical protein
MVSALTQQIIALAREGVRPCDIKQRLGAVQIQTVYTAINYARRELGIDIPKFTTGGAPNHGGHRFTVPIELHEALKQAARRRGLHCGGDLARQILETVVRDDLFAAVLDG